MPDKISDNDIKKALFKEKQEIRDCIKRHKDLTDEIGQDLLQIDEEYTGGSKVWLTTDFFHKVFKHFCHSNYLVKCMELMLDYINRLEAENEKLKAKCENTQVGYDLLKANFEETEKRNRDLVRAFQSYKAKAYKEFAERAKEKLCDIGTFEFCGGHYYLIGIAFFDNLLKEMVGD